MCEKGLVGGDPRSLVWEHMLLDGLGTQLNCSCSCSGDLFELVE